MQDALANRSRIARRIERAGGAVVMLDFDGTLVKIVGRPDKARMSAGMRRALSLCARRMPVAIVTGRALADVKKRVRLGNVSIAGNHGMEWFIAGKRKRVAVSPAMMRALRAARKELMSLEKRWDGVYVEDKMLSISVHFRRARAHPRAIEREVRRIARGIGAKRLRIIGGILVLNILPKAGWDKGRSAAMMASRLKSSKNAVPVFIGDDETDEDAFRALRRGITIRVKNGKSIKTAARYTLNNVGSVRKFLLWLAPLETKMRCESR